MTLPPNGNNNNQQYEALAQLEAGKITVSWIFWQRARNSPNPIPVMNSGVILHGNPVKAIRVVEIDTEKETCVLSVVVSRREEPDLPKTNHN